MPDIGELAFDDRLALLLEREKTEREQRRYLRLKGLAKLHLDATIEETSTSRPTAVSTDPSCCASPLVSGSGTARPCSSPAQRGSGKSYRALGHQACRLGISTRYFRVSRLLDQFALARSDGSYPRLVQRLAKTWLLVLDDWGRASLSDQGRHDLLEVLEDRYARRGTILASQLPVEHWHDVVGDPTFGDAILDRVLNNAHRITLKGGLDEAALRLDQGGSTLSRPRLIHPCPAPLQGSPLNPDDLARNRWTVWPGTGGRLRSESVDGLARNSRTASLGMGGRLRRNRHGGGPFGGVAPL